MSPWKVVMAPPHGTFQIRATSRAEHPSLLAASDCVGRVKLSILPFLVRYNNSDRHSCISFPLLLKLEVTNAKMAKAGHMHLKYSFTTNHSKALAKC